MSFDDMVREAHKEDPAAKRPDWGDVGRCETCGDDEAIFTATDTGERDSDGDATWHITCDECGSGYRQVGGGLYDEDDCTVDDEYPAGYFDD
jgi:DNA-directed RNA polymerase subunit M/transcription elongation factor TFIIS